MGFATVAGSLQCAPLGTDAASLGGDAPARCYEGAQSKQTNAQQQAADAELHDIFNVTLKQGLTALP